MGTVEVMALKLLLVAILTICITDISVSGKITAEKSSNNELYDANDDLEAVDDDESMEAQARMVSLMKESKRFNKFDTERKKSKGKRKNKQKNKRNSLKNKRKNKGKKRKNKNKGKKRKNKNKNKRNNLKNKHKGNTVGRQDCPIDDECVTLAVKYAKFIKDRIGNYKKKITRTESSISLIANKEKKNDIYDDLVDNLKTVTGVQCTTGSTTPAAQFLQMVTNGLTSCKAHIKN